MKRFSAILCAGLLLAAPALAATPMAKAPAAKTPAAKATAAKASAAKLAPGDLKSGGAVWNISSADSLNQALVVNLVTAPPKRPVGDKDVLAASGSFLKSQKAMKGCAAAGAPQPILWGGDSVWVVSLACK